MYNKPFDITENVGNNAFSFDQRKDPKVTVASLIEGSIEEVKVGSHIAFEDFDEYDKLQSCKGLEHFIFTHYKDIPVYIFDNNNHSFYFWYEALEKGFIKKGAHLFHIDGHRDTRNPERDITPEEESTLEGVFHYTNFVLNVGNYIPPAENAGMIKDQISVISEQEMDDNPPQDLENLIVNIDLDFWAEELDYISWEKKIKYVQGWMQHAKLMTICTSPFFVDQERAIRALHELFMLK